MAKLIFKTAFLIAWGGAFIGCASVVQTDAPSAAVRPAERAAPVPTEYMPEPAVLIYSETRGWRHEEGIAGGNLAVMEIAQDQGLGYFTTQHAEIFNPVSLSRFELIVFNSATGDSLNAAQKAAFEAWLADDGAVILIHGSIDASQKDWSFYQDELVGPHFISHPMAPQFQAAEVVVLKRDHPVMAGLPDRFVATDEWYSFDGVPDGRFVTLAGLDETTYSPRNTVYGVEDLRMGDQPEDHAIIWARCLPQGGRVVASALGHTIASFDAVEHRQLLANAINWTMQAGADTVGCE
jgi:type 1 glutamine amidotransferase